jgi:hypothetical protein
MEESTNGIPIHPQMNISGYLGILSKITRRGCHENIFCV